MTVGETTRTFEIRSYQIITLGVYDGTPMKLKVDYYDPPTANQVYVYGYQLDVDAYKKMLETLSDEQLEVTKYDSTSLEGTVTAKESGLLFLTIPYSEGWYATVDGEPAEITNINDALMAIRLDAGKHDVRIEYIPAGFKPGVCITCASIVVIILLAAVPALVRKVRSSQKAVAVAATEEANVPKAEEEKAVPAEPSLPETPEAPAVPAAPEEPSVTEVTGEPETPAAAETPAEPSSENGDGEQ